MMNHCHFSVFTEKTRKKYDGNVKRNGTAESVLQAKFRHKFSHSVNSSLTLLNCTHLCVCVSYKFTCLHYCFAIEDTALELHRGFFSSNRTFSVFRARLHVNLWVEMNAQYTICTNILDIIIIRSNCE